MNVSPSTIYRYCHSLKEKGYLKREQIDEWKYNWDFSGLMSRMLEASVTVETGLTDEEGPLLKDETGPYPEMRQHNNTTTTKQKEAIAEPSAAHDTHTQGENAENIVLKFYDKLGIDNHQWLEMDTQRCQGFLPEFSEKEILGMLDKRPNIRTFKYLTLEILRNCYPNQGDTPQTNENKNTLKEMTENLVKSWEQVTPASNEERKKYIDECKQAIKQANEPPAQKEAQPEQIEWEDDLPF